MVPEECSNSLAVNGTKTIHPRLPEMLQETEQHREPPLAEQGLVRQAGLLASKQNKWKSVYNASRRLKFSITVTLKRQNHKMLKVSSEKNIHSVSITEIN